MFHTFCTNLTWIPNTVSDSYDDRHTFLICWRLELKYCAFFILLVFSDDEAQIEWTKALRCLKKSHKTEPTVKYSGDHLVFFSYQFASVYTISHFFLLLIIQGCVCIFPLAQLMMWIILGIRRLLLFAQSSRNDNIELHLWFTLEHEKFSCYNVVSEQSMHILAWAVNLNWYPNGAAVKSKSKTDGVW